MGPKNPALTATLRRAKSHLVSPPPSCRPAAGAPGAPDAGLAGVLAAGLLSGRLYLSATSAAR